VTLTVGFAAFTTAKQNTAKMKIENASYERQ
jgi:hypothetical protein